jgi:hypothetical protein
MILRLLRASVLTDNDSDETCQVFARLPEITNAAIMRLAQSGRGAVRLARLHGVQEVGGSNPLAPTESKKKPACRKAGFDLVDGFPIEGVDASSRPDREFEKPPTGRVVLFLTTDEKDERDFGISLSSVVYLFTCQSSSLRLSLHPGVVKSWRASWSSKPVAGRVAGRGGFDSHPLPPIRTVDDGP